MTCIKVFWGFLFSATLVTLIDPINANYVLRFMFFLLLF